jgi:peptide/nickel transport system permease protein
MVLMDFASATVIGIALGVYTASRQYKTADRVATATSIITLNINIVVAALGIVLLAIGFNDLVGARVFYVTGSSSPGVEGFFPVIIDTLQHLILPTLALVLIGYAGIHFLQRSLLLDNINADYVRTARAKGLTKQQAIRKHALRTSLIPVTTQVAFSIPAIFTGAILTESIFGWRGMGQYFSQTLATNDINGTVAIAAFGAVMTAIGAMLADIAVVILDPRVRVS